MTNKELGVQWKAMVILGLWIVYGLLQIIAAYQGIAYYWGPLIAIALLLLAFSMRFPLLITLAAFFGAWQVWGLNWIFALLFAMPGLALLIPIIVADLAERLDHALHPEHLF